LRVPFLEPKQIDIAVEAALSRYRGAYGGGVPIKVEQLLEVMYDVTILPLPGITDYIDCGLSADGSTIWVDQAAYELPDGSSHKHMRFSFAHEVGHLELHKNLLPGSQPQNYEDLVGFANTFTDKLHGVLETQANMFAARLLMPTREVEGRLAARIVQNINILRDSHLSLEQYARIIASSLADEFDVSTSAMTNRLAKLDYTVFTANRAKGALIAECDMVTLHNLTTQRTDSRGLHPGEVYVFEG
jgi:Zn-dependent peptidase ImmA (M78 family)